MSDSAPPSTFFLPFFDFDFDFDFVSPEGGASSAAWAMVQVVGSRRARAANTTRMRFMMAPWVGFRAEP